MVQLAQAQGLLLVVQVVQVVAVTMSVSFLLEYGKASSGNGFAGILLLGHLYGAN